MLTPQDVKPDMLVKIDFGFYDVVGVVTVVDESHVLVNWEDGSFGRLYWDRRMKPSANRLEAVS